MEAKHRRGRLGARGGEVREALKALSTALLGAIPGAVSKRVSQ